MVWEVAAILLSSKVDAVKLYLLDFVIHFFKDVSELLCINVAVMLAVQKLKCPS